MLEDILEVGKSLLLAIIIVICMSAIVWSADYTRTFNETDLPFTGGHLVTLNGSINETFIFWGDSDWLSYDKNVTLQNTSELFGVDISIPNGTAPGNYTKEISYNYSNSSAVFNISFNFNILDVLTNKVLQVDHNTFEYQLFYSLLPYKNSKNLTIGSLEGGEVTVLCNGFLSCPSKLSLSAGENKSFQVNISVPSGTTEGTHNNFVSLIKGEQTSKIDFVFEVEKLEAGQEINMTLADCISINDGQIIIKSDIPCLAKMGLNFTNTTTFKVNKTIYEEKYIPVPTWDFNRTLDMYALMTDIKSYVNYQRQKDEDAVDEWTQKYRKCDNELSVQGVKKEEAVKEAKLEWEKQTNKTISYWNATVSKLEEDLVSPWWRNIFLAITGFTLAFLIITRIKNQDIERRFL